MLARLAVVSICVLLGACATPASLKASAEHGTVSAAMPAAKAAACLQTAFENLRYDMQTRMTPLDAERHELVVRYDYGTLGVMNIGPGKTGTEIEYWIDHNAFTPEPPALVRGMLARCR